MERDRYACTYCGSDKQLEADHILPLSRGGSNAFVNLATACWSCNLSKGSKDLPSCVRRPYDRQTRLRYGPRRRTPTAAATADWRESHNATASNVLEVRRACYRLSLTPASNRVGAGCPQVQSLRLDSFASRFSCSSRLLVSYPRTGEKVMGRSAPVCQI